MFISWKLVYMCVLNEIFKFYNFAILISWNLIGEAQNMKYEYVRMVKCYNVSSLTLEMWNWTLKLTMFTLHV